MNNTQVKRLWGGVVVAIVIAITACFLPLLPEQQSVAQKAGDILDTFTGSFYQASHEFAIGGGPAGTLRTGGGVITCGSSVTVANVTRGFTLVNNPPGAIVAVGACNVIAGNASSTVIAIGPFTATSTVTQMFIYGTSGATSTDLLIATSTVPSPAAPVGTSTLNENILGFAGLAAATQFWSEPGVTMGSSKGYTQPASGPYKTTGAFQVGVGDYILLFSTSTNPVSNGGIGSAQVAVPSLITMKMEYQY